MPTWAIVIIIAAIVVAAVVAWLALNKRRSQHLQTRFGPEYDRAIQERGNRQRAEDELEQREKRVKRLDIRPLDTRDRARFADAWRADQARFVDDPNGAVGEADRLVQEVMRARGYPVAEFEQRVDDISVDHPHVVQNYRAACAIVQRQKRGEASTEDLRKALVNYRDLFDELLEMHEVRR